MSISVGKFLENLESDTLQHEVDPLDERPVDMITKYIKEHQLLRSYRKPSDALTAIKRFLSLETFYNPGIRKYFRPLYENNFMISSKPTQYGRTSINSCHMYQKYKYMSEFKITDFYKTYDYLLIDQAVRDNFIKVTEKLHKTTEIDRKLRNGYLSTEVSDIGTQWNKERLGVLKEVRDKYLFDYYLGLTKQKLVEESIENLGHLCTDNLEKMLMARPYRFPRSRETSQNPTIAACSIADQSVDVVILGPTGGLIDHKRFAAVLNKTNSYKIDEAEENRIKNDKTQLELILRKHTPSAVVLAADSIKMRDFKDILDRLRRSYDSGRLEFDISYIKSDISVIASRQKSYSEEFSSLTENQRKCISIGRRFLDPLQELGVVTYSNDSILTLNAHLKQSFLPKDEALKYLERAFLNVVAKVGVSLKDVRYKFGRELLKYVPGFGKHKADDLLLKLSSKTVPKMRKELKDFNIGDVVFRNCCTFLKIEADNAGDGLFRIRNTRIHLKENDEVLSAIQSKLKAMVKPSRDSRVELFDYENLSKIDRAILASEICEKYDRTSATHEVNFVISELMLPYNDPRTDDDSLSNAELFYCLIGDSPENIRPGAMVNFSFIGVKENSTVMFGKLDNELDANIPEEFFSDERVERVFRSVRLSKQNSILCKIRNVDYENFSVELTCRSSDLQNPVYRCEDVIKGFYDRFEEDRDMRTQRELEKKTTDRPKMFTRTIQHPCFFNITYEEAESMLEKGAPGDFIFRPSSKGANVISLSFKIRDKCIVHRSITEEGKTSAVSLSSSLMLDGKKYDDLDEIHVSYVTPIITYIQDLETNKNVYIGPKDSVVGHLKALSRSKSTVPYCIHLDSRHPLSFTFVCLQVDRAANTSGSITINGYEMDGTCYKSSSELIAACKQKMQRLQPRPQPSPYPHSYGRTQPPPPPPRGQPHRDSHHQDNYPRHYQQSPQQPPQPHYNPHPSGYNAARQPPAESYQYRDMVDSQPSQRQRPHHPSGPSYPPPPAPPPIPNRYSSRSGPGWN